MTQKNPIGNRPRRKSLSDYTFNVNDIERSLTQGGGKLSTKQKHTIENLKKLDKDGDGDISLLEILALEEDAERAQKDAARLRKIVCGIVIGIIFCLGCIMCMGIAAIEITKESRVKGGTPVAKASSGAAVTTSTSSSRRLGGGMPGMPGARGQGAGGHKGDDSPAATNAVASDLHNFAMSSEEQAKELKKEYADHCGKCMENLLKNENENPGTYDDTDPECLACDACMVVEGGAIMSYAQRQCPTKQIPDPKDTTKKATAVDEQGLFYGAGSDPFHCIEVDLHHAEYMAKLCFENQAPGSSLSQENCNYNVLKDVMGSLSTIVSGASRQMCLHHETHGFFFDSCHKVTFQNEAGTKMVEIDAKVVSTETSAGFTAGVKIIAETDEANAPAIEVSLNPGGEICIGKGLVNKFKEAGLLPETQVNAADGREKPVCISRDKVTDPEARIFVSAACNSGFANVKPGSFHEMVESPIGGTIDHATMEFFPPEMETTLSRPSDASTHSHTMTNYKECNHDGMDVKCDLADPNVVERPIAMETECDSKGENCEEVPVMAFFEKTETHVAHDEHHEYQSTVSPTITDQTTGCKMHKQTTTITTHNTMDDTAVTKEEMFFEGETEESCKPPAGAEMAADGSIHCGDHICATAGDMESDETLEAAASSILDTQRCREVHPKEVASKARRLREKHASMGRHLKRSRAAKGNKKHVYHPLLAAHAHRSLLADISSDKVAVYECDDGSHIVEDCTADNQWNNMDEASLEHELDNFLPEGMLTGGEAELVTHKDHDKVKVRRLAARRRLRTRRRLTARRLSNVRHTAKHRVQRLARNVHVKLAKIINNHNRITSGNVIEHVTVISGKPTLRHFGRKAAGFCAAPGVCSEHNEQRRRLYARRLNTEKAGFKPSPEGADMGYAGTAAAAVYGIFTGDAAVDSDAKAALKNKTLDQAIAGELEDGYEVTKDDFKDHVADWKVAGQEVDEMPAYKEFEAASKHYDDAMIEYAKLEEEASKVQSAVAEAKTSEEKMNNKKHLDAVNAAILNVGVEIDHATETMENAASTLIASKNLDDAATAMQGHMDALINELDEKVEVYQNKSMDCASDSNSVNTPVDFDFEHYDDTGVVHDHECGGNDGCIPFSFYCDFEQMNDLFHASSDLENVMEIVFDIHHALIYESITPSHCVKHIYSSQNDPSGAIQMSEMTDVKVHSPSNKATHVRRRLQEITPGYEAGSRTEEHYKEYVKRQDTSVSPMAAQPQEDRERAPQEDFAEDPALTFADNARRDGNPGKIIDSSPDDILQAYLPSLQAAGGVLNHTQSECNCDLDVMTDKNFMNGTNGDCYFLCDKAAAANRTKTMARDKLVAALISTKVSLQDDGAVRLYRPTNGSIERMRKQAERVVNYTASRENREEICREANERRERADPDPRRDTRGDERVPERAKDSRENNNKTMPAPPSGRMERGPIHRDARGAQRDYDTTMPPRLNNSEKCNINSTNGRDCSGTFVTDRSDTSVPVRIDTNVNGRDRDGSVNRDPHGTRDTGDTRDTRDTRDAPEDKPPRDPRQSDPRRDPREGARANDTRIDPKSVQHKICFPVPVIDGELEPMKVLDDSVIIRFTLSHEKIKEGEKTHDICVTCNYDSECSMTQVSATGEIRIPDEAIEGLANECFMHNGQTKQAAKACCPSKKSRMAKPEDKKIFGPDVDILCKENNNYDTIHKSLNGFPVDIQVAFDPESQGPVIEISGKAPKVKLSKKYRLKPTFGQKFYMAHGRAGKFCVQPNFMPPPMAEYKPMGGMTELCDGDHRDSEARCEHAKEAHECNPERCIWDNMTSPEGHCIPLPGDESNRPHVEVEDPTCEWSQARCEHTMAPGNRPECVARSDDNKCSECKDRFAFFDPQAGEHQCKTPSPEVCGATDPKQFFCKETGSCVYDCYDCQLRSNATDIPGIELKDRVPLLNDHKSRKCVLPSPNSCHARGEMFCEASQQCIPKDQCNNGWCRGRHQPDTQYTGTYKTNATEGVRFQSKDNATYGSAVQVCKVVTEAHCKKNNQKYCTAGGDIKCVDNCAFGCGERVATTSNSKCVRPKDLDSGYFCKPNQTTVTDCKWCKHECSTQGCWFEDESTHSRLCELNERPLQGWYRCNMTTDRESVVYDVEDCHAHCQMYDHTSNKHYTLPKPDHTEQTCGESTTCPPGTVICENKQNYAPDGTVQPTCVSDCESCYKEEIGDGTEMTKWVHMNVNVSNVCKAEQDQIDSCKDDGDFWCAPTKTCGSDCDSCKEEHEKETLPFDNNFEMYSMDDNEREYNIQNYDTMMCENSCGQETKTIEGSWEDWDGTINKYSWDWSEQKTYCPIKKSCLKNNFWPFNDPANPAIESYDHHDQMKDGPPNPCSDCGAYTLTSWTHSGKECIKPSMQSCKDNWMRYCPSTKQCVHTGTGCANSCPGYGFEPPHMPNYDDKADAVSCLATADEAANMCSSGESYCSVDEGHCTQSCDWCSKWTQGTNDDGTMDMYDWVETKSVKDSDRNICSFHGAYEPMHVETHPEPPAKNVTEVTVCMANCTKEDGTDNEMEFQTTTTSYEEKDYDYSMDYDMDMGMDMGMDDGMYNATANMVSEWVHSYYCKNHPDEYVDDCSYCEEWMDGNGMVHYSNMVPDENYMCVHPEKYGCTDKEAFNYDPEATALEAGEDCPDSGTGYCWSCNYTSFDNSDGMNTSVLYDTTSYDEPRPYKDEDGMYMNLTGLMPPAGLMNTTW
jgi:hypothetical protein